MLLQMFPMALVCGNTMILKPSERNPGSTMFIMKLAQEAGIPDGCINVIHGSVERNNIVFPSYCSIINNIILTCHFLVTKALRSPFFKFTPKTECTHVYRVPTLGYYLTSKWVIPENVHTLPWVA